MSVRIPRGALIAPFRDAGRWLLRCRWLGLALPILPFAATLIHESGHAFACIVLGGRVTSFDMLPSAEFWGSTGCSGERCPDCVSLAPYTIDALAEWTTAIVALTVDWSRRRGAAWLFLIGFLVPVTDTANALSGWTGGRRPTDFSMALGPLTAPLAALVLAWGVAVAALGWLVQRRLFGRDALSPGGYALLALAAVMTLEWGLPAVHALLA